MWTNIVADPTALALAALGVALGGVLKGAIGAGAPVIGVPMLALAFDVPTAVVIFSVPNLFSNIWQVWAYRAHHLSGAFTWSFALSGLAGTIVGTFLLVGLSPGILSYVIASVVFLYVGFRLMHPQWQLGLKAATRAAAPVGLVSGVLQGAIGISAPVSISFLNAMRLERPVFIATVSAFFIAMAGVQIPMVVGFGLMNWELTLFGLSALVLILAAMPLGSALGRRLPRKAFDWLLLVVLTVIATGLLISPP
ncbi:sulfite exporter TauE/SafE family protein [Roseibium sp.]|uniref:sulfite exporter TauE/SafE family protein n=1 Tax=Roseibium sp. TaxID=1936156 RepID=UPI00391B1073